MKRGVVAAGRYEAESRQHLGKAAGEYDRIYKLLVCVSAPLAHAHTPSAASALPSTAFADFAIPASNIELYRLQHLSGGA
jgi:hypothetical protein